ncbi:MAG: carboxypeptidase-like regulatory domain-containing protein [Treponema sp.]|nr:carboxypeptidase-like regulatory domain-containing protein [Treponema sp.]
MKNKLWFFGIIILFAVIGTACYEIGGDGATLSGEITIDPSGTVNVGTLLTAYYSGDEEVIYQWRRNGHITTEAGGNEPEFRPGLAGDFTVTVSAYGYVSKTSLPVTVLVPFNIASEIKEHLEERFDLHSEEKGEYHHYLRYANPDAGYHSEFIEWLKAQGFQESWFDSTADNYWWDAFGHGIMIKTSFSILWLEVEIHRLAPSVAIAEGEVYGFLLARDAVIDRYEYDEGGYLAYYIGTSDDFTALTDWLINTMGFTQEHSDDGEWGGSKNGMEIRAVFDNDIIEISIRLEEEPQEPCEECGQYECQCIDDAHPNFAGIFEDIDGFLSSIPGVNIDNLFSDEIVCRIEYSGLESNDFDAFIEFLESIGFDLDDYEDDRFWLLGEDFIIYIKYEGIDMTLIQIEFLDAPEKPCDDCGEIECECIDPDPEG